MAEFGFDNDMFKESKKKYKKKKEEDKKEFQVPEDEPVGESPSEEELETGKKPRKISQKERQTLLTNFRKRPETIEIDENDQID